MVITWLQKNGDLPWIRFQGKRRRCLAAAFPHAIVRNLSEINFIHFILSIFIVKFFFIDHRVYAAGKRTLREVIETKPDLVVLDLLMPGLDGIEVCKRIKQNKMLSGTKIIILTGMDTALHRQKSMDAGADAFQSKNDSPKKIFNLIEQMLR